MTSSRRRRRTIRITITITITITLLDELLKVEVGEASVYEILSRGDTV